MAGLGSFGSSVTSLGSPNNWSFTASPFHGVGGNSMTMLQLLHLLHEQQQKPQRSFVQSLKHGVGLGADPVLWAFDKIERPAYAVADAVDKGVSYHHISPSGVLTGLERGITGKDKMTFGQVFKDKGILDNHKVLRGLAGFGADVALDPLTYASAGSSALAKPGEEAAFKAGQAVLKDASISGGKKGASDALAALKPHLAALSAAGEDYAQRAALAEQKASLLRKMSFGSVVTNADRQALSVARATARAERESVSKKVLSLGTKNHKFDTPIPLPSMEKIGKAGIPGVSAAVHTVGKGLVPGYDNRIVHAGLMARKHSGEQLTDEYIKFAQARFKDTAGLDDKEQRKALHFFEKKGGVVEKDGELVLNPERIKAAQKAGVSSKGLDFVQAMHDVSQHLHAQHALHGLDVGHLGYSKGQLYVPHMVMSDGTPLVDRYKNLLTQRGFVKNRQGDFSVAELHKMKEAGDLPKGVETSPYRLLTHHIRAVANQHADRSLLNHFVGSVGTSSRLVDKAALNKTGKALADAMTKAEGSVAPTKEDLAAKIESARHDLEASVIGAHHASVARDKALIEHHLEMPWQRHTMATVTRISGRNAKRYVDLPKQLAAIKAGTHPKMVEAIKAATAEHTAQIAEHQSLQDEVKNLTKQMGKLGKGKENPAATGDMMTIPELKDEHGHPYVLPREVGEAVKKLEKVTNGDDQTVQNFVKNYRVWLGKWKVGVTSVNPGYGVRNTLSDAWNMWLSGVPMHDMVTYGGKAAKLMRDAKQGDPKAISYIIDAYHQGVLSGLFQGDVQEIEKMLKSAGSKKALVAQKRPLALYTKITQDINRNRENWGRLTHYMYRRDQGLGVADAAAKVKEAHFDYEDLTPFEQKVMKGVAPFYTWTRKNVPFQVKMLAQHPGRMAAFPLGSQEAEGNSAKGDIIPGYMRSGLYVKLPGGRMFNPSIGVNDLEKLNPHNLKDTAVQLINPAFKVPAEILSNTNLTTGQKIVDKTTHPLNPVNDRFASLLSMLPGSHVGETERNGVHGAGIDPRWSYLFTQLPATNALFNQQGKIKGSQDSSKDKALAYLTGLSTSKNDQGAQQAIAQIDEANSYKGWLRGLRDAGLVPDSKKRKASTNTKALQRALNLQLGGG